MNMKVWSNFKEVVDLSFSDLNTITTRFCTDKRHRKCLARGKCAAQEPQCESDRCKMAGTSLHKYIGVEVAGSMDQLIKFRKMLDEKIAARLAKDLNQCVPYVLSWERVKNTVQARKKPCLPRKKRCRPKPS